MICHFIVPRFPTRCHPLVIQLVGYGWFCGWAQCGCTVPLIVGIYSRLFISELTHRLIMSTRWKIYYLGPIHVPGTINGMYSSHILRFADYNWCM